MNKKILFVLLILVLCLSFSACRDIEQESVTITFVTNVDHIAINPIVLDGVNRAYMPDDPILAGHNFVGWFYDPDCTQRFYTDDGLYKDITLYAKWQRSSSFNPQEKPDLLEGSGFSYEFNSPSDTSGYDKGSYTIVGYHGTKTDIIIPATYNMLPVTRIKSYALANNPRIESIVITSVLEKIEESAFENCSALKFFEVEGSDYYSSDILGILYNRDKTSIVHIGMAVPFSELEIPKEINNIQNGALFGCEFTVTFAKGSAYTALKENDFNGFKGELLLGEDITKIEQYGLKNFLGALVFAPNNKITTITMGAFDGYNGSKVMLPSAIQIAAHAFSGCKGVVDLSQSGINQIGNYAFSDYQGAELVIPNSVERLGEYAFHNSTASITFAELCQVTTIPSRAFYRFAGTVYFPESVKTLEADALLDIRSTQIEFANNKEDMVIADTIDPKDKRFKFGVKR